MTTFVKPEWRMVVPPLFHFNDFTILLLEVEVLDIPEFAVGGRIHQHTHNVRAGHEDLGAGEQGQAGQVFGEDRLSLGMFGSLVASSRA